MKVALKEMWRTYFCFWTTTVMAPNLRLNAVAMISPQNHPILIRTFDDKHETAIKYHYIAHTSLDVIEERGQHLLQPRFFRKLISYSKCQIVRLLSRSPLFYGRCRDLWVYNAAQGEDHYCLGVVRCHREGRWDKHGMRLSRLSSPFSSQTFL